MPHMTLWHPGKGLAAATARGTGAASLKTGYRGVHFRSGITLWATEVGRWWDARPRARDRDAPRERARDGETIA